MLLFLGSNIEELKYPQPIPDQNSEKNSRATSPSINSAILDNDEEFEEKDEAMAIFFLEILVRITILNKDRVNEIWPSVEDHMKKIIEVRSNSHLQKSHSNGGNKSHGQFYQKSCTLDV